MQITDTTERIEALHNDLSGVTFENACFNGVSLHNVTAVGMTIQDVDLSGVTIAECNTDTMTIDGIPVKDLLLCYRAHGSEPR